MPLIDTIRRYISNIAIVGFCFMLIGCGGGSSGSTLDNAQDAALLSVRSTTAAIQCSSGPADLSGVCRNTSALTMGALEAVES